MNGPPEPGPATKAGADPGRPKILKGVSDDRFRRRTATRASRWKGRFLRRDWATLLAICLLAVAIRGSVMALLPGILHLDEIVWLEQANRLVNHQSLVPWDFRTPSAHNKRARSWQIAPI